MGNYWIIPNVKQTIKQKIDEERNIMKCRIILLLVMLISITFTWQTMKANGKADEKKLNINQNYDEFFEFEPSFDEGYNGFLDEQNKTYYFITSKRYSDYRVNARIVGKPKKYEPVPDGQDDFEPDEFPAVDLFLNYNGKQIDWFYATNSYKNSQLTKELKRNSRYTLKVHFTSDNKSERLILSVKEIIHKPGKTKITSLKAGKRKLTVKYSKSKYARKYQVSIKKKGSKKWSKPYTTTKRFLTIKKLKCKRKYYVRVRGYLNNAGTVYKSKWSRAKIIKTR